MKQILFISLLAVCMVGKAQVIIDSTTVNHPLTIVGTGLSQWGTGYGDSVCAVTKWNDGRIEIHGDTLRTIKMLIQRLEDSQKREVEREVGLYKFIDISVKFLNNIPAYWKDSKNNKTWPKYYAELKKLGYKIVKK